MAILDFLNWTFYTHDRGEAIKKITLGLKQYINDKFDKFMYVFLRA